MVKKVETRGRPELPKKEKRSVVVQFRCTESERLELEKAAVKVDKSLSDWLRDTAIRELPSTHKAGR
ncbi:hypothetical protein N9850_08590 [Granulosicoccus sp.]|nr:hypothetical protein [Granulosicoccus sp.]MDB4223817.1 hypothetical protein [Granulosicoccus sp.]